MCFRVYVVVVSKRKSRDYPKHQCHQRNKQVNSVVTPGVRLERVAKRVLGVLHTVAEFGLGVASATVTTLIRARGIAVDRRRRRQIRNEKTQKQGKEYETNDPKTGVVPIHVWENVI
jgi:hypothetical protein